MALGGKAIIIHSTWVEVRTIKMGRKTEKEVQIEKLDIFVTFPGASLPGSRLKTRL